MPSLSDRLKSLGVKVGGNELKQPQPQRTFPIEDVVPGRFEETSGGATFIVETLYARDYRHGIVDLQIHNSMQIVGEWAGEPHIATYPHQTYAFLDTETSGLTGGTGTFAFLVGAGFYTEAGFQLVQLFMSDPLEEPGLLLTLEKILASCKAVITFNGKSFDIPLLNTRYKLQGWEPAFQDVAHIDLLHLARRLWRDRLPSRALGDLEVDILRVKRSEEEVPGWMIPQMYFDYLRSGDARPLGRVFYHNAMDILSMAALINHISYLFEDPLDDRVEYSLDQAAIARLYEDLGYVDMADNLYRRSLERGLAALAHQDTLQRLSLLHKRHGDIQAAIILWQQAAEEAQIYAHVELAKYYEHNVYDFDQAVFWTQAALQLINAPGFPRLERYQWQADLEHRLERLQRRQSTS